MAFASPILDDWSQDVEETIDSTGIEALPPWDLIGSSSLTIAEPIWIQHLKQTSYRFRRDREVSDFLNEHNYLFPLLIEGYQQIEKCFGEGTQVVLEVLTEPESNEEGELFALIQTSLPTEEATGQLEQLDQEWWLEASLQAECRLNVDVEYV